MLFPLSVSATDTCPAGYYPAEYVELEYIESDGNQWIDTRVKASTVTKFEYKFMVVDPLSLKNTVYIGGAQDSSYKMYTRITHTAPHKIDLNINDILSIPATSAALSEIFTMSIEEVGTFYSVTINEITSIISVGNKPTINFWIFANNYNNNKDRTTALRVYDFKLNGASNLHFIPVRRVSDGAVGMYDKVEGKFYGNDGTGEFIAGPELQSFIADENGDIGCVSCPANTYKPNAGNESCTKCPEHTFSPVGSTSLSDCAKILRVKDYVVYMPLGKRTEHGLCVMSDGKKYCADVYERQ